jgi:uncharacterized protein involved in outer membrane biogenesis
VTDRLPVHKNAETTVMRWPRRIFLYLLLPILIFVAATAVLQAVSQLNAFARQVEGLLESAIGREIKIAGGIEANLFRLNPSVVLKDVTIANAAWAARPAIAKIARLKVEARLWPVLIGEVRLRRIAAEGARIWLETGADGRGNWELAARPETGEDVRPLRFDELRLVGANVTFQGAPDAPESRAAIHSLTIGKAAGGAATVLRLRGTLDALPVEIAAETGPLARLFEKKPSRIVLKAKIGASDLAGTLTLVPGSPFRIEGALKSKRLVVGPQPGARKPRPGQGAQAKPKAKGKAKATARPAPRPRAAATPIPADLIKRLSLNVSFAAGHVEAGAVTLEHVSGTLNGADGKLVVKPARAVLAGTPLAGTLTFDAGVKPARLTIALAAGRIAARNLKTYAGGPVIVRGRLSLSVRATSTGDSFEDLQRRLNTIVNAKLGDAIVTGLPWRPTASRTSVPRLAVTLVAPGLAVPRRTAPKAKTKSAKPAPRTRSKAKPGKPATPDPAAALAQLRGRPLKLRINGVFGRSDIAGTLALKLGARTHVSGSLVSRRIDLGGVPGKGAKREPLFPPDPLPVDLIRGVEGRISYRIQRAELGGMGIPNIVSTVSLRGRVLTVRSSGAGADAARLLLVMDARGPDTRTALDVSLDDTRLAAVIAGKAGLKIPQGSVSLRLRLRGAGNTLKATVAGANGLAVFVMRTPDAEKGSGWIAGLGSGLIGTISTVVTRRGGPLRCIVARVLIVKGVGRSEVLLVDTQRLSFFGQGTLDLRRESVDALFVPRQKLIGVSRIKLFTVRMSGPIERPKARLDFGAAALETAKSALRIAWLPVKLLRGLFGGKLGKALDFDPCPVAIRKVLGTAKTK